MARLGKFRIRVDTEGSKEDQNYRIVEFVINVNMEGEFTTTLDADLVFEFEQAGISLTSNGRANGRDGFFSAKSKDDLCKQISEVYQEMYSRELIEEKRILRYQLATTASYGFTVDGAIIPNLSWEEDGVVDMEKHWVGGTVSSHSASPQPTGVQMYIKPLTKLVYKYRSGKEVVEYKKDFRTAHHTDVLNSEYHWCWLANIVSTIPSRSGTMREIDYTEETGKFFVTLYKTLCQMASLIATFEQPEKMKKLIASGDGIKFLGS